MMGSLKLTEIVSKKKWGVGGGSKVASPSAAACPRGHFAAYTREGRRFFIPIAYLASDTFREPEDLYYNPPICSMRGRRKRGRRVYSPVRTRSRKLQSPIGERGNRNSAACSDEDSGRIQMSASRLEVGSGASRSTVRLIHQVVSNFDKQKIDLVKSIGFHGILEFPSIKQFNRKFTLWLMSCVNEESCSLRIGDHINIPFNKADVGRVLGIPSAGRRILDDRISDRQAKEHVLGSFLGDEFRETRSIKLVQEVIERDYDGVMSKKEADIFRVAFVVFAVSNLLAPSAKYDYASIDYWNAIQDPDSITSFDWSDYVIQRLIEGVSKLRKDISSNIKYPNITGCSIFLQVFYLDSLDLGNLSLPHNCIPRISLFSYEKLQEMIAADTNFSRTKQEDLNLPLVKLREASGCTYAWALEQLEGIPEETGDGCMMAIWECAVAMVQLLNIPLEAAGPIFVAASEFQNLLDSGLEFNGIHAIKLMSVLVSIMIPYRRGFRYQSSSSVMPDPRGSIATEELNRGISLLSRPFREKRKTSDINSFDQCRKRSKVGGGISRMARANDSETSSSNQRRLYLVEGINGDHVHRSLNSLICSIDSLPHDMNVSLRVAATMSKFYGLLRKIKSPLGFDLNEFALDGMSPVNSDSVTSCVHPQRLPSPWDLGFVWSVDEMDKEQVRGRLCRIEAQERMAVAHNCPKNILVSAVDLRDQFLGKVEMELDLFDALIRQITQQDDELYSAFGDLRWRIFFESDFMESIVSGSYDLLDSNLRDHLLSCKKTYDISRCKFIFFPALLQFSWLCFVWCIEENVICVFDPINSSHMSESRVEAIERAIYLLKLALQNLCRSVFIGWTQDVSFADTRVLMLGDASVSRLNWSGVMCSLFCRCYDGADLNANIGEFDTEAVSCRLYHDLLKLKDNGGSMPDGFI